VVDKVIKVSTGLTNPSFKVYNIASAKIDIKVTKTSSTTYEVKVPANSTGLYFLSVENDRNKITKKLIVNP
jgi:hypothetical protein